MKEQFVLLRFTLEKDVDTEKDPARLRRLASQACWSIDGVAKCEHIDVSDKHFKVTGEVPDTLHLEAVAAPITMELRVDSTEFQKALVGWDGVAMELVRMRQTSC